GALAFDWWESMRSGSPSVWKSQGAPSWDGWWRLGSEPVTLFQMPKGDLERSWPMGIRKALLGKFTCQVGRTEGAFGGLTFRAGAHDNAIESRRRASGIPHRSRLSGSAD